MNPAMLAVIGAGPKAAALAARVAALQVWHLAHGQAMPLELHIFERSTHVAAHWYGGDGYTDGAQEVCTSVDNDLVDGTSHAGAMRELAGFTWSAFVASHPDATEIPTHRRFADYIAWALDLAIERSRGAIQLHLDAEVTRLRRDGDHWMIETRRASATARPTPGRFDGVVVTSPGPAVRRFHVDDQIANRIGDARSYWSTHRDPVRTSIAAGHRVAVVGGGGAAAAICVDALRTLDPTTEPGGIVLVAPQATLFTRGDSYFENEILTDRDAWSRLALQSRRQVSEHLISGVVFRRVLDQLEALDFAPAFMSARAVAAVPKGDAIGLWCLSLDEQPTVLEVDRIIDASGFDALWFTALLDEPVRTILRRLGAPVLADRLDRHLRLVVDAGMYDDSELRQTLLDARPGLHVPFLAGGAQPPGRASLLQLGQTASEVLAPYLR